MIDSFEAEVLPKRRLFFLGMEEMASVGLTIKVFNL